MATSWLELAYFLLNDKVNEIMPQVSSPHRAIALLTYTRYHERCPQSTKVPRSCPHTKYDRDELKRYFY